MFVMLLLTGCSAVRLAYNSAPQFSWWWLDSYFDFDGDHGTRVRDTIDQWFAWHRKTQLADYADWLKSMERRVSGPVTGPQLCAWFDDARRLMQPAIDRGLEGAADLVPGLGPAQLAHLEQRQAKNLAEARREHLQADAEERRQATLERTLKRFERVYGTLEPGQRRLIEAGLANSPFDAQRSFAERERRQRDLLQALRRWQSERTDRAHMLAGMRQLAERAEYGGSAAYRAYQQRLTEFNCRLVAEVHNATSPAQRQAARRRFREWEEDLRALVAQTPSSPAQQP